VFKELIERIGIVLNGEKISYMIIGGQAVLYYGEPRFTKDIDIALGVDTDSLKRILALVANLNFSVLVDNVEDFVKRTMVLPTMDVQSGIRVDFVFSHSHYEQQALERARNVQFDKTCVKFASLEDVIIHKIIAGRPRDIEDVSSILLKNQESDYKYIARWLRKFDDSLDGGFVSIFKKLVDESK